MTRRITRKQLKEDEFVSAIDPIIRWVTDNWRVLAAGIGGVCVLALLWWIGSSWSASRAQDASYALHEATTAVEEGATGADLEAAESKLREVIDQFGRSEQADVARLYLARILIDRDQTDEARQLLLAVTERRSTTAIGRLATLDLIHLRIASGQADEVSRELEAMVVGADPRLPRDVALFELGRIADEQQNAVRAREYFQKLVDEFPESPYTSRAQQRLSQLG
jgi:predicted negative regulator of RcsB-dependent stress response